MKCHPTIAAIFDINRPACIL